MGIAIVTEQKASWLDRIAGIEIVDPRDYLTDPDWSRRRYLRIYNLSDSFRYQSLGYYVSLLAEARGHRPLPSVANLQDLRGRMTPQMIPQELDTLIQKSLQSLATKKFTLSVYFGRNLAKRHEKLARELYNHFQAPLMRFEFQCGSRWRLQRAQAIGGSDVPDEHREFVLEAAARHFAGRAVVPSRRATPRYDLAVLHSPEEGELAPSCPKALDRFHRTARKMGVAVELLTRRDAGRLLEFDGLFIRETTAVNHHTYRLARRAEREGLTVIDDPLSILRCTNKVFLAELLTRNRVPIPKTLVSHRGNIQHIASEVGWPCVLKKPDSAFSQGVTKVSNQRELDEQLKLLFEDSELVIAQQYLRTDFDWRIGILEGRPLYACKYHMARGHWQIIRHDASPHTRFGKCETIPVELAPRRAVAVAQKAAALIGNGLYGVDVKEAAGKFVVIEVNDNPNLDAGVEDKILGEELYRRIVETFIRRMQRRRSGDGTI